ncbi:Swt1 family HEPN domain-containing protein [Methylocapsa palsarum]|uniref:Swt1 family HEPN domain-containing protein n=1 Tax=Methylocapsa palsarum TaxID=1612308 RepID=UPI001FCD0D4B|nr:Swt1 family HEPN domain-containing protein [Methylocapsa palsarum]
MAITNQERIAKALDLLKEGLAPFAEREIRNALEKGRQVPAIRALAEDPLFKEKAISKWDASLLLKLMWDSWNDVFRDVLGPAERGLVGEIRGYRNRWAHQEPFTGDDTDRALDSIARLLTAVSAQQGGRRQSNEDRAPAADLRRAGAQGEAQGRWHDDRKPGDRKPQAVARGCEPTPRCGERPLPASGVRS